MRQKRRKAKEFNSISHHEAKQRKGGRTNGMDGINPYQRQSVSTRIKSLRKKRGFERGEKKARNVAPKLQKRGRIWRCSG